MKPFKKFFAGVLVSMFAISGYGQERWSAAFRPGLNFTTEEIAGNELKTGFGFEATVAYNFMPRLAAYAGWGWNTFGMDNSFGIPNPDLEETGYVFGLQYFHPFGTSAFSCFLRAGGVYNHWEIEGNTGNILNDTGHNFGWQAEAGVDVGIGSNWSLRPPLRYRSLSRHLEVENFSSGEDLNYLSLGIGLAKKF